MYMIGLFGSRLLRVQSRVYCLQYYVDGGSDRQIGVIVGVGDQ